VTTVEPRTFPTESESLIAGHAASFSKHGLRFYEDCEKLGPLVRVRLYDLRVWVVTGPDLIEEVLVKKPKSFDKPRLLKGMRVIFGDGLLTSDGDHWKHRRRLLQPVFHSKRNAGYAKIFERGTERFLTELDRALLQNKVVDVHPMLIDLCISNMTESLFGVRDPELNTQIANLAHYCQQMVQEMGTIRFPAYSLIPGLVQAVFGRKVKKLGRGILERVRRLRGEQPPKGSGCPFHDVFSQLSSSKDRDGCPMGDLGIRDEMVTVFLAGHETAAAAISWALQLLAQHPDVRAKLAEEITSVCGGDRLPTFEDLPNLPYLENVIAETYRLYPPTHRMGRTVIEPVEIGGVKFQPGDEVVLPQWAIHRSERWFDRPNEFIPERWTEEMKSTLPRYAYLPFSAGPRVCIGQQLVMIEDALILGAIAQRYDYELAGKPEEPFEGLTLLPGTGRMELRLSRRDARDHQGRPKSLGDRLVAAQEFPAVHL